MGSFGFSRIFFARFPPSYFVPVGPRRGRKILSPPIKNLEKKPCNNMKQMISIGKKISLGFIVCQKTDFDLCPVRLAFAKPPQIYQWNFWQMNNWWRRLTGTDISFHLSYTLNYPLALVFSSQCSLYQNTLFSRAVIEIIFFISIYWGKKPRNVNNISKYTIFIIPSWSLALAIADWTTFWFV